MNKIKNCDTKLPNLFATVVLYNKNVRESITCINLLQIKYSKLNIIILDNSTCEMNNRNFCKHIGAEYISMNGNRGLSAAYNCALEYLKDKSQNDFIIWLDDDTKVTQNYFDVLVHSINDNPGSDIFVPIVYGQNGVIYSPNEAHILKNRLIKSSSDIIHQDKFNAINSCLAVRLKVYNDYRYNEKLFLDQVDQNFFDDLRKMKYSFIIINAIIYQNFSQRGKHLKADTVWKRYQIRITDMMIYCRKNWYYNCCGFIKVCGWSLQMGIKCKSVKLIVKCCKLGIFMFLKNFICLMKKQKTYDFL